MGTPTTSVGPGLGAFLAFFALAIALWLLMRNMNARMRRMAYREQERIAALEARERAERGESPAAVERGESPAAAERGESPAAAAGEGGDQGAGGPGQAGRPTP